MVLEQLIKLLSEQFGVDADSITMDTALEEDLGADSQDLLEMAMALEEEFDVGEISEETARVFQTVGDVVEWISAQSE